MKLLCTPMLALAFFLVACGQEPYASASERSSIELIGTITAEIDGQANRFEVAIVFGESEAVYADGSARFGDPGFRITGYEDSDPGRPGLAIAVRWHGDDGPPDEFSSQEGEGMLTLGHFTAAVPGRTEYALWNGSATLESFSPEGPASGTFSGTLARQTMRGPDPSQTIEITNGHFEVSRLAPVDRI